jgi:HPt (histidine-containing phosphotransfer) domain-containing protein
LLVEFGLFDGCEEPADMSGPSESAATLPLVDEAGLQRLIDTLGPASMAEMIAACILDVRQSGSEMKAACAARDGSRARRAAHKLAGVLGQYACPAGAAAARVLADGDEIAALEASGATMPVIDATLGALEQRLISLSAGLPGSPKDLTMDPG